MTLGAQAAVREADGDDFVQLVTFNLGAELFALEILKVQEIIRVFPITPVPHCPAFVDGVITLRGKIVPVVDLRTRFGMPRAPHGPATRVVVAGIGPVLLGLVVDRVHEVTRLERALLEPAGAVGGAPNDYVTGVGRLGDETGDRLVTLVDVAAVGTPIGMAA
jgi:purine-binding chemotaxis protein CheW